MAWVNNNKKNARFNPNRKDDRLLTSEVTSRREHRKRKEAVPEEELISTSPDHVLSMQPETRVDWLQMAMMQAATGKLKATPLYEVIVNPKFAPGESSFRKQLKALVLANLHLFSAKQKKTMQEALNSWGSAREPEAAGGERERERSRSRRRGAAEGDQRARDNSGGRSSSSSSGSDSGASKASSSSRGHRRRGKSKRSEKIKKKQKDAKEAKGAKDAKDAKDTKERSRSRPRSMYRRRKRES